MPQGETAPEPWASAMTEAGAISSRTGKPSMRKLAEMSELDPTTVSRIVFHKRTGKRGVSAETISALAEALRLEPAKVADWCGQGWSGNGPYIPPPEVHLLGPRARKAIDELIRATAEIERKARKA